MKWANDLKAMVDFRKYEPMDWKTLASIEDNMKRFYPGDYNLVWDFERASVKLKFEDEQAGLFWMLRNS
jgi:hypothetical protein